MINEIHASVDPALGDANADGLVSDIQDEFVEIVNNFDIDVNIAGWTLSDATMVRHTFPPGTVIRAAEAVVVFGGGVPTGSFGGATVQTASTGLLSLDDLGDTVSLTNTNGVVVASYTYGAEASDFYSISRIPDVTGPETTGLIPLPSCVVGADCAGGVCVGGACPGDFSPGTRSDGGVFTDTFEGLYGRSRQLFETFGVGETSPPGSTDFDDLRFNARGKGINVAVIEWAYYEGHEDLDVITEPGWTLLTLPENFPDHATACLGIINGQENSFGVTGIAPEAEAYFFPLTAIDENGLVQNRDEAAFLSAYETLNPGDVVSCSFGPPDDNLNNILFTWTLLRLGSDIGITSCVAAGNDCENLSQGATNLGDSGAIVVGAGQSGFPYCRLTFSNFFSTGDFDLDSNVVHCQAWGRLTTTCGYGFLANPDNDPNRFYTDVFGGTSSAAPQIAGLAACLQGLARQAYGIHLQPDVIRSALAFGGLLQCGILDPDDLPGFPAILDCGPDLDPDSGPNKIGIYPFLVGGTENSAARFILNFAGFNESPLVDGMTVLTGELIQGNVNSIKASDDNHLIIESRFASPTDIGGSSHGGLASGQTTDVMIEAHMESPNVNTIDLFVESHVNGGSGIELVYLFDWQLNRWLAIGVDFLDTVDPDDLIPFTVENAARFVRASDNKVLIRVWTVSLGVAGQYRAFHDWVNIERGGGTAFISGGP